MTSNQTLRLVVIANLTAISTFFYVVFKFEWYFATFLDIQFSNVPAIIAGFILGPTGGAIVVLLRTLLKLLIVGSSTGTIGELADIVISVPVVMVSATIYMKHRTKKGAIIASLGGMVTWIVVALIANYFFLVDLYIRLFFNGSVQPILAAMAMVPGVNEDNYMILYILYGVIPMNFVLSVLVFTITFIVYKKISILIHDLNDKFLEIPLSKAPQD